MRAWAVHGVELPFGTEAQSWWIDGSGSIHDRPIAGADPLPGRYVLPGLVDAHAHPAVGVGPAGYVPLGEAAARANLIAWAQDGITLVRDVGSPAGVTLEIGSGPGMPGLQAAGRFLAPAGRYFPDLLGAGIDEASLVSCALAEIGRGAAWVKVIADFPDLAAGTDAEATYPIESIAQLAAAVHQVGARVPVLAGTDVTGSIPQEVALLSQTGLDPQDALAAASIWPRRFLGTPATADIVTYHHDPRADPDQLRHPAAVVASGTRLR